MRVTQKFLVLGVTLAGLMSVMTTGCNKHQDDVPVPTTQTAADDTGITTKVKSALLADPAIKSFDLKVETRKGAVQLSGFVNDQVQIDQAIAIAGKVGGVTSVRNEMSIKK